MARKGHIRRSAEEADSLVSQATVTIVLIRRRVRGLQSRPYVDGVIQLPCEIEKCATSGRAFLLRSRHCAGGERQRR